MSAFLNLDRLERGAALWNREGPFDHAVIDGFFDDAFARQLAVEFPTFDAPAWHRYDNALELKRTCNDWNAFGPATYSALAKLSSPWFVATLSRMLGVRPLFADPGLNGGGLHIHGRGGKLNPHLDYVLHPKTGLQRKLNVLVYLNPDWEDSWGGHLALWNERDDMRAPGEVIKRIAPRFNRAVIFDTTQRSWHGLPEPIDCPESQYRKSLAAYYMTVPARDAERRGKALFAPTREQEDDADVLALIERRAAGVYR